MEGTVTQLIELQISEWSEKYQNNRVNVVGI